MTERDPRNVGDPSNENEHAPVPGEQPPYEEVPPIDHAPVPPLTTPSDTEGG